MSEQEFRTEPPTYREIFSDEYLHWLALLVGVICAFLAVLAGAVVIHLHITEVTIVAESEASAERSISDRPTWGYYATFLIYSATAVYCVREFVQERRKA